MKKLILLTCLLVLVFAANGVAIPPPLFDVWQDTDFNGVKDTYMGSIYWYAGPHTTVNNYNYSSASAHPLVGPNPEAYKSKMFFYNGPDGVSFNFFHNIDNGGNNYWNHVGWDFHFLNMNNNLAFVDDGVPENRGEPGIVPLDPFNYHAGWAYTLNTDGGLFNQLSPMAPYWEIVIDPYMFGDIQEWQIYSGDGSHISLWNNPSPPPSGLGSNADYGQPGDNRAYTTYITTHVIPEPTTLLLLGAGLLGAGLVTRKKIKK